MPERKNRPKAISEKAKELIIEYSLRDTNQPREVVANILRKEIRKLGERPPRHETLKRKISGARNQPESPLDKPWHLGLMAGKTSEYHISAEAVPYVLMVQSWAENFPTVVFKELHPPLTIRQALWVARLYGCIMPKAMEKAQKDVKMRQSIGYYLYQWSEAYATRERICELSGTPFNTKNLDRLFCTLGEAITAGKSTMVHYRKDRSFDLDTIDEELLKQMEQIKEKDGEA